MSTGFFAARRSGGAMIWVLTLVAIIPLLLFFAYPVVAILMRSVVTDQGIGLGNFTETLLSTSFLRILGNTVTMAVLSTGIAVVLAFGYAFALTRTAMRFRGLFRIIAFLPLFSPSLVQGQGLLLLFGRNGIINRTFGIDIEIYGLQGIVVANLLYIFPYCVLILSTALATGDQNIYDGARTLGANAWRRFFDVTLPGAQFGIAATVFVAFTLVITDFGNAMIVGGDYDVLATEIYNQVIGQARFGQGAVIGVALLVPAILAKVAEKRLSRRQASLLNASSKPLDSSPWPGAIRSSSFIRA